jgi:hypothetical protein
VRLPGRGRPEPPAKLAAAESAAWRAIVDASPDGWLDGAGQLILRRIVAEIAVAERHEERLRRIAESGGDLEAELEVASAHRVTMKSIIEGLTALRATPKSKMMNSNASQLARNAFTRSPSGRRPWDIEATASKPSPPMTEADDGEGTS